MKAVSILNDHSELLSKSLGVLYPFILIIGVYITLNGHRSPGGGFQGGAVIAAVFIGKYLILPIKDTQLENIQRIEKITLVFILLIPISFMFMQWGSRVPVLNTYYMVIMNALIGLKVTCGFSLIFYRFVYYEVR